MRERMNKNRMAAAFTKQATAMRFQMAHEIDAFHAGLRGEALADHGHPGEVLL
jgi:hypothetical protein